MVGIGFAIVPIASADDGPILLKGVNVVEVPQGPLSSSITDAKRELLRGDREGAICRFRINLHAENVDTTPQMASMVEVDSTTCMAEIERGTPGFRPSAILSLGTTNTDSVRVAGKQRAAASASASGVGTEGVNADRKSTFWYIYEDPIDLRVNYVRNSVRSNVKNRTIPSADCSRTWYKFDESGWNRDGNYKKFDCNTTNNKATSAASEHFYNDTFLGPACSGRDRTHVYYVGNTAKVTLRDYDGFIEATWDSGGCASILNGLSFFEPAVHYKN